MATWRWSFCLGTGGKEWWPVGTMAHSECACLHFRESLGQLGWNEVTQGMCVSVCVWGGDGGSASWPCWIYLTIWPCLFSPYLVKIRIRRENVRTFYIIISYFFICVSMTPMFVPCSDPNAHALMFPIMDSVRCLLSCLSPTTGARVMCVLKLLALHPPCPVPVLTEPRSSCVLNITTKLQVILITSQTFSSTFKNWW